MPLYPYIPYLDPEDTIARKSFSGKLTDAEDDGPEDDSGSRNDRRQDATHIVKVPSITRVDSYKRKVNENLKVLNLKVKDLLHDGLNGVDTICQQAKGFVEENKISQNDLNNYMENCGRGDIFDSGDEKKCNSPATESSHDAMCFLNPQRKISPQSTSNTNVYICCQTRDNIFSMRESQHLSLKKTKPDSLSIKSKKCKDPKHNHGKLSSRSFNVSLKQTDVGRCAEKAKTPRGKYRKTNTDESDTAESKPAKVAVNESAKKRLGQIERDYQKVVENLGMVERMMACINRKVKRRKSEESTDTEGKQNKGADTFGAKRKFTIASERSETFEVREMREFFDTAEKECAIKYGFHRKRTQTKQEPDEAGLDSKKSMKYYPDEKPRVSPKPNESLSDIDAMIDNAVQELRTLPSSDFYISQNSSDVSFDSGKYGDAKNVFDDRGMVTNTSDSDENDDMGEDSEKFDISRSFQELKDSYLKKIKLDETIPPKKSKKSRVIKQRSALHVTHIELKKRETNRPHDTNKAGSINSMKAFIGIKNARPDTDILTRIRDCESTTDNRIEERKPNHREKPGDSEYDSTDFSVVKPFVPSKSRKRRKGSKPQDSGLSSQSSDTDSDSDSNTSLIEKVASKTDTTNPVAQTHETKTSTVEMDDTEKEPREEITIECNENPSMKVMEQRVISDSELYDGNDDFEANRREERNQRKQQRKKIRERKSASPASSRDHHTRRTPPANAKDKGESTSPEKCRGSKSATKTKQKRKKARKKPPNVGSDTTSSPQTIKDPKKMETHFSVSSSFVASSSSGEDSLLWVKNNGSQKSDRVKPIDPMEPVSNKCKKMFGDLVQGEDMICLQKLMDGHFNTSLIQSVASMPMPCRFRNVTDPTADSNLKSITPEVHRKRAISDLHDRMEIQIRQTDSFDGFLNLMNRNRRKAIIKQAEKQDHNVRCHMKSNFRKRYPFRVVTASVPANTYENKMRERKDPERKFVNSLWFSPKDFKLRRNSRIFNRKRMDMYCQSLNKGPMIQRCREVDLREIKKASNYSIKVRSGTPLGRRPNTPRRWVQGRPSTGGVQQRARLHHCDILDDLTIKDLAPFDSEYPRHDDRTTPQSLHGSLLFKLACGNYKGDAEGTLMELIAPRLSCTQVGCKICKPKTKTDKKALKKCKPPRKHTDDGATTAYKTNDVRTLTPKAAAKLLVQNIGEIKSKKSTNTTPSTERNFPRHKETKKKRSVRSLKKSSKKTLSEDSRSMIHQRIEDNLMKKLFHDQYIPFINIHTNSEIMNRSNAPPRRYDLLHRNSKVPELNAKNSWRKSTTNKLFPYINDPNHRVFQNITALPVEVVYDYETLRDPTKDVRETEVPNKTDKFLNAPVRGNEVFLSETDEFEAPVIDYQRPSTGDDRTRKVNGRKRHSTPRSCSRLCRHDAQNKPNIGGSMSLETRRVPCEDPYFCFNSKTVKENHQANRNHKIPSRKFRTQRTDSIGKSTESDNGSDIKYFAAQHRAKRIGNPMPWKPASNSPGRPKTPPVPRPVARVRSKEMKKLLQIQQSNTSCIASPHKSSKTPPHKIYEKFINSPSKATPGTGVIKEKLQEKILINRDNKLKFEIEPTKVFYNVDYVPPKPPNSRAYAYYPLNPTHRVMVDHLHALKNRNVKLQSNIQRAIGIIEEKMADALSTNDHAHKKKTIERMEKEINKVLKIIDEQSYKTRVESARPSNEVNVTEPAVRVETCLKTNTPVSNEETTPKGKALITPSSVTMPKPPRKRSISRIFKPQNRPCTVEEEIQFDLLEDSDKYNNLKDVVIKEKEVNPNVQPVEKDKDILKESDTKKSPELYPSITMEGQPSLCPILRCPSLMTALPCRNLSQDTQKALSKMSKEAFGKFADVIKTKTKLIINMTERFDLEDANLLPKPEIKPTLPTVLVKSPTSLVAKVKDASPSAADLMGRTVSSVMSIHKPSIQEFIEHSADVLSPPTTQISEFRKICSRRSHTSFSESECSYTWRRVERTHPINMKGSASSLRPNISKDLTPFMKALNKLRAGRLFDNCEQLFSIEETSSSFTKLMDFLEGLSNVKEGLNPKVLRDVQLLWNPEKRCSFHSSMKCSRGVRYATTTKAISEHSIDPSSNSSSSCSQIESIPKIEEKLSKTDIRIETYLEKPLEKSDEDVLEETSEEPIKEIKEIFKPDQSFNKVEYNSIEKIKCMKLVFSDVHIISIPTSCDVSKIQGKRSQENRYAVMLKLFYLSFYALVYCCMNAMNFTC